MPFLKIPRAGVLAFTGLQALEFRAYLCVSQLNIFNSGTYYNSLIGQCVNIYMNNQEMEQNVDNVFRILKVILSLVQSCYKIDIVLQRLIKKIKLRLTTSLFVFFPPKKGEYLI